MYQALAKFYNKYTRDIDYTAIAGFAYKFFKRADCFKNTEKPIVVDLGCGTGTLTRQLTRYDYDMIGVDISTEMLDIAKFECHRLEDAIGSIHYLVPKEEKTFKKYNILWLCQDMRKLDLYGTAAGMICATDGVNHIIYQNDLEDFFKRVYNFLEYSGVFIFDVLTEKYFRDVIGSNTYCDSDEEESCIWTSHYMPKRRKCIYDITLYRAVKTAGYDMYQRSDDLIEEKAWNQEELESAINKAGLVIEKVYANVSLKPISEKDLRRYYICRKYK